MTKLPASAGLFLVPVVDLGFRPNRFAISDFRQCRLKIHIELPRYSLDGDLHMNIAETMQDGLRRLRVPLNPQGRILFGDTRQCTRHLVHIRLCYGVHRQCEHWVSLRNRGESHQVSGTT